MTDPSADRELELRGMEEATAQGTAHGSPGPAPKDHSTPAVAGEEFDAFLDHRWVGDAIEIKVQWTDSPPTWEPEALLQRGAAESVYGYWAMKGGRPQHPTDPERYTIFAILGHSRDRKSLRIQWTEKRRMQSNKYKPGIKPIAAKSPRACLACMSCLLCHLVDMTEGFGDDPIDPFRTMESRQTAKDSWMRSCA